MPAVRKLLLADDSITIQKIVALTFADAGIEVIAVGTGTEAVEKLQERSPDIVLADVFMPGLTGYEVCEHIKKTEHLKHIPVMLLVGSFEPFNEAEARKVGADDILTKPFQSIKTLMDKVGALLGRTESSAQPQPQQNSSYALATTLESETNQLQQSEGQLTSSVAKEADTKELPTPEEIQLYDDPMTTEELEITTADTQPLSAEIKKRLEHSQSFRSEDGRLETTMHTTFPENGKYDTSENFGEVLLELDEFPPRAFAETEEVILDIDFNAPVENYSPEVEQAEPAMESDAEPIRSARGFSPPAPNDFSSSAETARTLDSGAAVEQELPHSEDEVKVTAHSLEPDERVSVESLASASPTLATRPEGSQSSVTLEQLSPEVIDAIARRVVEQMSAKAVQEIAWEVVPQLADLMIKRKLEEHQKLAAD